MDRRGEVAELEVRTEIALLGDSISDNAAVRAEPSDSANPIEPLGLWGRNIDAAIVRAVGAADGAAPGRVWA